MLKFVIAICLTILLSSCYYAKGCIIPPEGKAFCPFHAKVLEIQQWQKNDSIGNTNENQRWLDFQECGVKRYNNGKLDFYQYPNLDSQEQQTYTSKVFQCMKNKGYIRFSEHECQTESQIKLNGKCN